MLDSRGTARCDTHKAAITHSYTQKSLLCVGDTCLQSSKSQIDAQQWNAMEREHNEMMKHNLKRKRQLEKLYPRTVKAYIYNTAPLSLIV